MKPKLESFKTLIMSVVKILGLYSTLPTYGLKALMIWVCIAVPFIPIFIYYSENDKSKLSIFLFIYLAFYLIQTLIIRNYIARIGHQWNLKEYEKLSVDQATFPFILVLGIYALYNFILFMPYPN